MHAEPSVSQFGRLLAMVSPIEAYLLWKSLCYFRVFCSSRNFSASGHKTGHREQVAHKHRLLILVHHHVCQILERVRNLII